MENHENPNLNLNPNEAKIKIGFELLNEDQLNQFKFRVMETMSDLGKNNKLQIGGALSVKISMAFDKEEPKRYIHCKLGIVSVKPPEGLVIPFLPNQPTSFAQLFIEDLDVYKEENVADWFDVVEDTKRENEKNDILYKDTFFNKEENKIDNPDVEKQMDNLIKDALNPNQNKSEEKVDDEIEPITDEEIFDYYNPEQVKYTAREYVKLVNSYGRFLLSQIYQGYVNDKEFDAEDLVLANWDYLKHLQSKLSTCDFSEFTKSELSEMGFGNWKDKYMLVPLWLLPIVIKNHEGMVLYDVRNGEVEIGKFKFTYDKPIRYGCSPYGIIIEHIKFKE